MNTLITKPGSFRHLLSPGQRFYADDLTSAFGSGEVTLTRLDRDKWGLEHVVLRTGDGRELSAFIEQIEYAIAEGNLRPIASDDTGIAC